MGFHFFVSVKYVLENSSIIYIGAPNDTFCLYVFRLKYITSLPRNPISSQSDQPHFLLFSTVLCFKFNRSIQMVTKFNRSIQMVTMVLSVYTRGCFYRCTGSYYLDLITLPSLFTPLMIITMFTVC